MSLQRPRATDHPTVVVLAGGTARRFGSDKLAAPLGGSTVLDTVLEGLPPAWPVVVVGPPRECARAVAWAREDPPGGGPLAGVAAGLERVAGDVVAVVAGDMPYAAPAAVALVEALLGASPAVHGVVAADDGGHENPLLAAYRVPAVRAFLPSPAHDRPAKLLLGLPHTTLPVPGRAGHDVDTPADLEALSSAGAPPDEKRGSQTPHRRRGTSTLG